MKLVRNKIKFFIGVDEVGRGALAGPVAVGAVSVPRDFDWKQIAGVRDSKQLSERKREEIFNVVQQMQKEGLLRYAVSMTSAGVLDRIGMTRAVTMATARALLRFDTAPQETFVKLDGLLHAPHTFQYQETIVRGDQTEKEIALASICAKVTRDRLMCRLARKYPDYSFEIHKGYGTAIHRRALKKCGPCDIHRLCFKGVVE